MSPAKATRIRDNAKQLRCSLCPIVPPRPRVQGLTLIELLVVIALIGVLASLMLPSLARGRSAAQRVRCISNLHQLGLATQLYWDDHESLAFRYREGSTNNGDLYWFGWLQRGSEGERRVDHRQGVLYPYLAGRGVEICPSLRYGSSNFKLKASGAAYGYGYNLALSPTPSNPRIQVRNLPCPTSTALFADAAQVNDFQAPASKDNPMLEEFYYVTTREPTVHFRHQARANVVFADGHVGTELPADGSIDARLPAEVVGRLRAEVLMIR
jgi:prepilin-type N-terminal cleavage/methylation domain-containing protein/prepilin-type processing-associated H-X9-DG protein